MVTKEMLKNALTQLGVEKGMVLEVHSSLSSFGEHEGGAETVINTLKEIVTEEGSIFMPALRLSRVFFDIWSVLSLYENELKCDPYGLWGLNQGVCN